MRLLVPLMVAALLFAGCGEDVVVERPGEEEPTIVPDEPAPGRVISTSNGSETEAVPPPDSTTSDASAPETSPEPSPSPRGSSSPDRTQPRTQEEPATPPPPRATAPTREEQPGLEGGFTLATVDGKGLPVVTDTRPDCQIEVLSGRLTLVKPNRFTISTATREKCDGRITTEDVWEASGTVRQSGSSLHFEGASGENFGTADGVLTAGVITIQEFGTEAGTEVVNWRFVR